MNILHNRNVTRHSLYVQVGLIWSLVSKHEPKFHTRYYRVHTSSFDGPQTDRPILAINKTRVDNEASTVKMEQQAAPVPVALKRNICTKEKYAMMLKQEPFSATSCAYCSLLTAAKRIIALRQRLKGSL
jgi:hypothetical protein